MSLVSFPVIDPAATGRNIMRLRLEQGLTVRDVQVFFGFEEPQAIYKWQSGKSLPTVDNLYALSALLDVQMDEILVAAKPELKIAEIEPQAEACGSIIFIVCFVGAVIELLVEFDDSIVNWRNTQNSRVRYGYDRTEKISGTAHRKKRKRFSEGHHRHPAVWKVLSAVQYLQELFEIHRCGGRADHLPCAGR